VSRTSDFSRKQTDLKSIYSLVNIVVVEVRNLAIIREDCPVNLLKEVKKALMVMQIGTMKN